MRTSSQSDESSPHTHQEQHDPGQDTRELPWLLHRVGDRNNLVRPYERKMEDTILWVSSYQTDALEREDGGSESSRELTIRERQIVPYPISRGQSFGLNSPTFAWPLRAMMLASLPKM